MAAFPMSCARLAPALVARLGARTVCAAGLVLIAVGLVVLAQLTAASGYWLLLVGLIPLGAGMGLATTPATSGITSALPAAKRRGGDENHRGSSTRVRDCPGSRVISAGPIRDRDGHGSSPGSGALSGWPTAGRAGGMPGSPVRRGPDHRAGTASSSAATAYAACS